MPGVLTTTGRPVLLALIIEALARQANWHPRTVHAIVLSYLQGLYECWQRNSGIIDCDDSPEYCDHISRLLEPQI